MFANRNHITMIFILVVSILNSCKPDYTKEIPKPQIDRNNEWIGHKVIFPESIKKLNQQNLTTSKSKTKFTIVAYYNGNCSVCYIQLMKWFKTMEILNIYDVSFKFILSGSNITVLESNLQNINFPLELVFQDAKDEFGEKYNFLLDNYYVNASILLDRGNNILFTGNPTISDDDKFKFMNLIKK